MTKMRKWNLVVPLSLLFLSGCYTAQAEQPTLEIVSTVPVGREKPKTNFYENIQEIKMDEADSYQVLVNKNFALSSEYAPKDMRLIQVLDTTRNLNLTIKLRSRAADMIEKLFQAASEDGLELLAVSGYRSYAHQEDLYNYYVREHGKKEADRFSARPGHSEHQTGLAIDVSTTSLAGKIEEDFGATPEGLWLVENAARFGFIIRYPQEREEDTGFMYEPWHLRYVGVSPANIMGQNNWIFEEYVTKILKVRLEEKEYKSEF